MAWIKRNLYFLIGGLVALALLGTAGFYLFTKHRQNNELTGKLDAAYGELNRLNQQNPHPGNTKVDNIKIAKEQQRQVRGFITRAGKFFEPVAPIPEGAAITDEMFAAQLRNTIEQLQRAATAAGITLPPHYEFSFSAIKSKISFASGSLRPLAEQLGEVKAVCDILFHAKINSLDSVRRRRVSLDDKDMADYTELPATTNDLGVLVPYELTFRCFSGELAEVLTGFAYSPHGFMVKAVTIEPSAATTAGTPESVGGGFAPPPGIPPSRFVGAEMMMFPGAGAPPVAAPHPYAPPVTPVGRGGLPTVLNERPLRVGLVIELAKLKKAAK